MPVDELVLPLLRVPLLNGLKPLQLTEMARRAARIVYHPGEEIIVSGARGDGAVLILSGEAACGRSGTPVPVGAMLGEMAMLVETEHTSTIVARTTVRALKILRADVHAQMAEDSTLADHFVALISKRLHNFASAPAVEPATARRGEPPMPVPSIVADNGEWAVYH